MKQRLNNTDLSAAPSAGHVCDVQQNMIKGDMTTGPRATPFTFTLRERERERGRQEGGERQGGREREAGQDRDAPHVIKHTLNSTSEK